MDEISETILDVLKDSEFITPNEVSFLGFNFSDVINAIHLLVEKGVLVKRDCEGLAYELK